MRPTIKIITFERVARQLQSCIKSLLCLKRCKSWLVKQGLRKVHVPPPKEIKLPSLQCDKT